MIAQLAEIRQTVKDTRFAVLAKMNEPLRPRSKRRPPMGAQVGILKGALERLVLLLPTEVEPTKQRPRVLRPFRRHMVVLEPKWLEEILPLATDPAEREQEITGCKMLLLEVVRRAAYDWVLYRQSRKMVHLVLAEQAYVWIFQEAPGHKDSTERMAEGKELTSFASICEHLDLQPDVVRAYIKKLEPRNVMSVGRPAEYRNQDSTPTENVAVGVHPHLVDSAFTEMAEFEEDRTAGTTFGFPRTWAK
jgi:hypothetical protein